MSAIQLAGGAVNVEASLIAADLGLDPERVLESMRTGALTAVCERGIDEDQGRYRLTFFHGNRRLRLVVDEQGQILERSVTRTARSRLAAPRGR